MCTSNLKTEINISIEEEEEEEEEDAYKKWIHPIIITYGIVWV